MSFSRQMARLEEDGLVQVTRIATEPFDSFEARFADEASEDGYDFVFLSQVYFDSGFAVGDLGRIVSAPPDPETIVAIDGYHGFMAIPTDLSAIADRAFYVAGGYKYAMAGEGTCFLHCPPGYGPRPRDTGWYAGFGALEAASEDVPYAEDGSRFLGATFDVSGLYRFNAVQQWLTSEGLSVAGMLEQVRAIERAFLNELDQRTAPINRAMLVVPDETRRGRFLAFRTPNAGAIAEQLEKRNVIVDSRGDRLRIGFGIYHETDDAVRVAQALAE
jgi:selenocysteine lyase/cysteine desulfurase